MKNFDQRHLAFGSPKLRLVTSIAGCARRYVINHDVIDKESNIAREGQLLFLRTIENSLIIHLLLKISVLLRSRLKDRT